MAITRFNAKNGLSVGTGSIGVIDSVGNAEFQALGVTGSITPAASGLYDIGSSTRQWRNMFVTNISGSITGSGLLAGQVVVAGTGGVLSGTNLFTYDGNISVSGALRSTYSSGDEGGELFFSRPQTNTSINTGVTIDMYQNKIRIFETGGTNRGGYFDISSLAAGVASNLASSPGGSDTHVQFNDGGSFGGNSNFTFTKSTNLLKVSNISGSITSSNVSAGQIVVAGTSGVLSGSNNFWWDNTNVRVGIGTSTVSRSLTLSRNTESSSGQLELRTVGNISTGNFDGLYFTQGASGATALGSFRVVNQSSGNPDLAFYTRDSGFNTESEKLRILNGGNVGIGITNPTVRLDIASGSIRGNYYTSTYDGELLAGADAGGYYFATGFGKNTTIPILIGSNATNIIMSAGGSERLRIVGSTGNVAIGTATPSTVFTRMLTLHNAGSAGVSFSSTNHYAIGANGNLLQFYDVTNAATRAIIDVTGNFGIGNSTTASARFQVSGSSTASTPTAVIREGVVSPTGGVGVLDVQNSAGTSILFITGSGRVGVGTITPQATFHVSNGTTPNLAQIYIGYAGSSNYYDSNFHFWRDGNTNEYMRINSGGNVGIGTISYTARFFVSGSSTASTPTMVVREGVASPAGGAGVFSVQNSAGTSLLFVSGSGNINMGTGTTSQAKLNILQSLGGTYGSAGVWVTDNATTSLLMNNISSGLSGIWSSGILALGSGGNNFTERLRVNTSGDVGIGTTSYSGRLFVSGSSTASVPTMIIKDGVASPAGVATLDVQNSAGNSLLFVSSSTYIGIGTNAPIVALDILSAGGQQIRLRGTGTSTETRIIANYGGSALAAVGTVDGYPLMFMTSNTERVRIDTSGNVGVGTSALAGLVNANSTRVTIGGSNAATNAAEFIAGGAAASISMASGASAAYLFMPGAYPMTFWTSGLERMRVDASGNVGIGTNNPARPLHVNGSLRLANASVVEYGGTSASIAGESSTNTLFFNTNSTERVRIDSSGNVGIGTVSPNARLDISGSSTASTPTMVVREGVASPTGGVGVFNVQNSSGTSLLFVSGNGAVGVGVTVPNATLEVNKAITFSTIDTFGQFVVKSASGTTGHLLNFGSDATNGLSFIQSVNRGTNATPLVLQRYGGNVGIGTSNVQAYSGYTVLDIDNATNSGLINFKKNGTTTSYLHGNGGLTLLSTSGNSLQIITAGSNPIYFRTNATDRVLIDSSGNLTPYTDNAYDLGSSSLRWRTIFAANISGSLTGSNVTAGQVVVAGTGGVLSGSNNLFWNNSSGSLGIGTSASTAKFEVVGVSGSLFSVTDQLSGSLFSVNTISGLPILEVFSDNTVVAGAYGSNALVVTGSNVGIGTSLPQAKLDIRGAASTYTLLVSGSTTFGSSFGQIINAGSNSGDVSLRVRNYNGTSDYFMVRGDGNVGIATASPLTSAGNGLTIYGPTNGSLYLQNSSNHARIFAQGNELYIDNGTGGSAGSIIFRRSSSTTESARIDSSGNLGVGTNNPGTRLDVAGAARSTYGVFSGSLAAYASSTGALYAYYVNSTSVLLSAADNSATAAPLDIFTGATRALRVDTSQNVGIGTVTYTARLFVSGTSTASTPTMVVREGVANPTGGALAFEVENSAGTSILLVSGSGNVGINMSPTSFPLGVFRGATTTPQISAVGTSGVSGVAGYNLRIDSTDLWQLITDNNASNGFYVQYNTGVAARYLAITTGGSVGIGVTNPSASYKLQVNGNLAAWDGTNGRVVAVPSNSANTGYIEWRNGSATRLGYMGGGSSTNMNITMENSANLLVDGGRVGMGVGSGVSGGAGNTWIEGRLIVGETANSASIFLPYGTGGTYAGFKIVHSNTNAAGAASFTDFRMRPAFSSGVANTTDVNVIRFNNTYPHAFPDVILVPSGGFAAVGAVPTPTAQFTVSGSSTSSTPTMVVKEGVASPAGGVGVFDVQNSAGTSLLFVSGSGNIGIGTPVPSTKLSVQYSDDTASYVRGINLGNLASQNGRYLPALEWTYGTSSSVFSAINSIRDTGAGGILALYTATSAGTNTERVRIDSSGNVGIGTAPGARLDVVLDGGANNIANALSLFNTNNSATPGVAITLSTISTSFGSARIVNKYESGNLRFYIEARDNYSGALRQRYGILSDFTGTNVYHYWNRSDGNEAMRLDASGNLGIGTSDPNGNRLAISGGNLSVTGSVLPGPNAASNGYDLGSTTYRWRDIYARSGSYTGDVTISGNLTVAGTQTIVNSDVVNIKDNIILLNSTASPQQYGGIYVADTTANTTGSLRWNSSTDRWEAGLAGSEAALPTGSGTTGYLARWASSSTFGNSAVYDDGSSAIIGATTGAAGARLHLVGGGIVINDSGSLHLNGNQNAIVGASRRLNYGDLLLGYNLRGNPGDDTYRTHITNAVAGYAGLDLQYTGIIKMYSFSGATTAGATVTPNQIGQFDTTAVWLSPRVTNSDFYINSSGNVGIGTTTPSGVFNVRRDTAAGRSNVTFENGAAANASNRMRLRLSPSLGFIGIDVHPYIESYCENPTGELAGLAFGTWNGTNNNERMRIDSGGTLLVGTTTSLGSAYRMAVVGGRIQAASTSDQYSLYLQYNSSTNGFFIGSPAADTLSFSTSSGTERVRIDSLGNVGINTTSMTLKLEVSGSDARIHDVRVGRGSGSDALSTAVGFFALNAQNAGDRQNTAVGAYSLVNATTGQQNTAVGVYAGNSVLNTNFNTAIGAYAGVYLQGSNNVSVGRAAHLGVSNVSLASNNTAVGQSAAYSITTGGNNTSLGANAGYSNTTGADNLFAGYQAGFSNSTASGGVALGYQAGYYNASGSYNISIGYAAGMGVSAASTTGIENVSIGYSAGRNLTSGIRNVLIGSVAGNSMSTGGANVGVGYAAAYRVTTNTEVTAVGNLALAYNTGASNTAIGDESLRGFDGLSTGGGNTAIGANSGVSVTTGTNNSIVGSSAGLYLTTGIANTFMGLRAGQNTSVGGYNVAIGIDASVLNRSGSFNTSVGYQAGYSSLTTSNLTSIGGNANLYQTGTGLVAVGYGSLAGISGQSTGTNNTAVGYQAGSVVTTGGNNFFGGYQAGVNQSVANQNVLVGTFAGYSVTSGSNNVAIGYNAGYAETTGTQNTWIGSGAGQSQVGANNNSYFGFNTGVSATGSENTALGRAAFANAGAAAQVTAVGAGAGRYISGNSNVSLGYFALAGVDSVSTGASNVAVGSSALRLLTTANYNIAVGTQAGYSVTTGGNNFFGGYQAGYSQSTAINNVMVGYQAGYNITSGSNSALLGYLAGGSGATTAANLTYVGALAGIYQSGGNNTGIGHAALYGVQSASNAINNTALGYYAGFAVTTGGNSVYVGHQAGTSNTTGASNVFVGLQAGYVNSVGNYNTYIGNTAAASSTTGSFNVVVGHQAGASAVNAWYLTYLGVNSGFWQTGGNNTAIGHNALAGSSGASATNNTAIGKEAGQAVTTGGNNFFGGYQAGYSQSTAINNVMVGYQAGYNVTSGSNNTFIGHTSGQSTTTGANNTFLGYGAGNTTTTGNNNIYLGVNSTGTANNNTNETVIGFTATGRGSNTTTIGNGSITLTLIPSGSLALAGTAAGTNAVSLGLSNSASSNYTVALGQSNTANNTNAVAIGRSNTSSGTDSTAIGAGNISSGTGTAAIGASNTSSGTQSVAAGFSNTASNFFSIALGAYNASSGFYSFAAGGTNTASGTSSVAMGQFSLASGAQSIAMGNASTGSFPGTIAIGSGSLASSTESIALGAKNTASGPNAVSIGNNSTASFTGSISIGAFNTASGQSAAAIGGSNIATGGYGFAAGYNSTASGFGSISMGGGGNVANTAFAMAFGSTNTASGTAASAMGTNNTASGASSIAHGQYSLASGAQSVAIGSYVTGSNTSAVAIGVSNVASGQNAVAIGNGNTASSTTSIAIGNTNTASTGIYAVAIGQANSASGVASVAIGNANSSVGDNSFTSGRSARGNSWGQRAHAAGLFASTGDAQISTLVARASTADASVTELFLDGSGASQRAVLPASTTWDAEVTVVGRSSGGTSNASFKRRCMIKRDASNNTALVGPVQVVGSDIGSNFGSPPTGWAVTLSADDTNESLKMEVTGAASTNIRWVAKIELTEVGFA